MMIVAKIRRLNRLLLLEVKTRSPILLRFAKPLARAML